MPKTKNRLALSLFSISSFDFELILRQDNIVLYRRSYFNIRIEKVIAYDVIDLDSIFGAELSAGVENMKYPGVGQMSLGDTLDNPNFIAYRYHVPVNNPNSNSISAAFLKFKKLVNEKV